MKQGNYKFSFILAIVIVCGVIFVPSMLAHATNYDNITSDSIKEKQGQISQAQQEKNVLQNGLTDVKKIMNELQNSKNNLEQYVTKLDSSLNSIEEKLSELKSLIEKKLSEIETTKAEEDAAPAIYAILPVVPLALILSFSSLWITWIKVDIVNAMIIGLSVGMIFEYIRCRNGKKVFEDVQAFFDGLGMQMANVITLIVAGQTFAKGLMTMGTIDSIIKRSC